MSTTDLQSTSAFRELIDLLRDADQTFLEGPRGEMDDINRVAGYRSLTHLLRYACELYLEADAQRPSFVPLAGPTCKILGDNVDSRYFFAPLAASGRYRIRGRRGDEVDKTSTLLRLPQQRRGIDIEQRQAGGTQSSADAVQQS